jgi:hypothetical protein
MQPNQAGKEEPHKPDAPAVEDSFPRWRVGLVGIGIAVVRLCRRKIATDLRRFAPSISNRIAVEGTGKADGFLSV